MLNAVLSTIVLNVISNYIANLALRTGKSIKKIIKPLSKQKEIEIKQIDDMLKNLDDSTLKQLYKAVEAIKDYTTIDDMDINNILDKYPKVKDIINNIVLMLQNDVEIKLNWDIYSRVKTVLRKYDAETLILHKWFIEARSTTLSDDADRLVWEKIRKYFDKLCSIPKFLTNIKLNVDDLKDNTILIVEFDKDLHQCVFKIPPNNALLTLENPILLWECPCNVPDKYRNSNYRCRIHTDRRIGNIITDRFGKEFTLIKYETTKILWYDDHFTWPPSIDSIFMAKVLRDYLYHEKVVRRILDIGCGTGFLGIYLAMNNKNVKEVYFSDIFLTQLFLAKINWHINNLDKKGKYAEFILSDGYENISKITSTTRFDLVVCNPPYLPTLGFTELASASATSGLRLLREVTLKTHEFADELIVGCSSMAENDFKNYIKTLNESGIKCKVEQLAKKETPFRIRYVFDYHRCEEYIDALLKSDSVYIRDNTPFKLWFDFYVYRIQYN